ncbi:MAG: sugar transferase [Candidatus Omnitrophica bacterium]|nr:sugar transferase [Candidatus Omnitrophota bacterium]
MIRIGRYLIVKAIYIFFDILLLSVSLFIACWIRQSTLPFPVSHQNLFFDPVNPFRFLFLFWISVIIFTNNTHGLYQTKREIFETVEIWGVVKSVFLSSLMMIVAMFVLKFSNFPRSILFLATTFAFLSLSIWRILKRLLVEYLVIQGYNNFNVLIIGAGKVGEALVKEIRKKPALGLNIVGYLDDFKEKDLKEGDLKILGKISDFVNITRRKFVNKIFITNHYDSEVFMKLLEQAKELGIAVRVIPHGFELVSGEFSKYNIGFIPILEYCDGETHYKQAGKRFFDFIAVICLAIAVFPILLVIAILIKLDSSGPVLYFSKRYGRGGRIFFMYKFRSMRVDADQVVNQIQDKNEVDGPIFKIRKDPRVTIIGRILRKYSLDELPQLFNVIKGDMSLVGPRPLPIKQVQKEDFRQLRRLEVRPGITGLWQIRGRSDISFARLVKWDVWYINNWSLWLDLNILLQTVPVVFKGKGAY